MAVPINYSIFDLFKIGPGPSSSHTIGPMKAALAFRRAMEELPDEDLKAAASVHVFLYGSLSATGKGHGTDRAIAGGLLGWEPETCDAIELQGLLTSNKDRYSVDIRNVSIPFSASSIHFDKVQHSHAFSNTMILRLLSGERVILEKEYYSIGGGFIKCKGDKGKIPPKPYYQYSNMEELKKILKDNKIGLKELVLKNEESITARSEDETYHDLDKILAVMEKIVSDGISTEGVLPGHIGLGRKTPTLYNRARTFGHIPDHFLIFMNAYALAAAEENAAGHKVVTAPTSGSAGVIPAVMYMLKHHLQVLKDMLREGLLAAAAIGFIVKHNASISGAEVGCQGEIGVASAMAAGLISYVGGYPIEVIENAAEIALEHHLGMTCDPVGGYVQIPCIERNAVAAVEAYNAYLLASAGDPKKQKMKFDQVVAAMLDTGRHMSNKYKETSEGGLALCSICC